MHLPRLYFVGASEQTLGRVFVHLHSFQFEARIFAFKNGEEITAWMDTITNFDLADYYIIDCWELFQASSGGVRLLEKYENKHHLTSFVTGCLRPLTKSLECMVYEEDHVVPIFCSSENQGYAVELSLVYAYLSDKQGLPFYLNCTDHDFPNHIQRIKRAGYVSPETQEAIIKRICSEFMKISEGPSLTQDFIESAQGLNIGESAIPHYERRCRAFLFLVDSFLELDGNPRKMIKQKLERLTEFYNSASFEREIEICSSGRIRESRFDSHIIEFFNRLPPSARNGFVSFLRTVAEHLKSQSIREEKVKALWGASSELTVK